MEIKKIIGKLVKLVEKYKYAIAVFLIGLTLLMIPEKQSKTQKVVSSVQTATSQESLTQDSLAKILQSVAGAGKVEVLLSMATGEETIYQTNTDVSAAGESNNKTETTVIITDSQRSEAGLIRQINPVAYKGAIVVCQGADNPTVRLAITQAVSKITGLGADEICVLKMQ